jgi:hypothetical protein
MYTVCIMNSIPQPGEVWQHSKTKGEYEIIGTARLQVKNEDLDMKECVIYKARTDEKVWVRPVEDFIEEVEIGEGIKASRFSKMS